MGGYFSKTIAAVLLWFALCTSAFAQVTPIPDNTTFRSAINSCLAETGASVTGECTNFGTSSGYGTMPNWDTSLVTDMSGAFLYKMSFNGEIGNWNTSNVINMFQTFHSAYAFNKDIGSWDVSNVVAMNEMFFEARVFNQDIGNWNTGSVTTMHSMFMRSYNFNQDISRWNTSGVVNMLSMFQTAYAFNQDIRMWDISSIQSNNLHYMFHQATQMIANYGLTNNHLVALAWFSAPSAPTSLNETAGDGQVSVAFTAPTRNGATISNYQYQLDGGSWIAFNPAQTSSPVVITGLTNGTNYSIKLSAVNSAGVGGESAPVTSTPAATSAAPTGLVTTPGDGQVSVAFTAPTSNGGAAITDYEYQLNGGSWVSASTTSSPVVITGLTNGTSYSIKLRAVNSAGNGAESAAVSVLLGSPASAFEEAEEEIKAIITQDATRSLTSTLSSNQRMTRGARSRFIESRGQGEGDGAGLATRNNVPFDVDGTFDLAGARLSSKGTFFGQTGNVEGTERRLVFGEFDVQRDGDTGSTTATLTGRVAWEQMISDDTMLGYFVGGELADSNISGAFEGKQTRVAATAGGYAVRALSETLFADGFISIGAGRNNLEMADDVLALTSDYTTRTATVGGALTGVYAYERYELRPEMAFSYGKTWIGDVGFTGVAYGLTDNTLSVDAGTVSTASLTLRPEIVWALDAETVADSHAQLSFAPRFICERTTTATTTQNCGAGAEIGLSSNSEDGLSSANIRFVMDRVGNSNRSNVVFNVEQRF